METSLLLVHSPLLGPSSWAATAGVLAGRGYVVVTPDLTTAVTADPPRAPRFVADAVAGASDLPGPVAVVGHSGAGAFLPAIGAALGDRLGALVFVDAVVPPRHGVHETSARLRALLDEQTTDGVLRRWLDWWPAATLAELLPGAVDRELLGADLPRVPRAFYDEAVPVPDGWSAWPCAYLRLSAAYDAESEDAVERGWLRGELDLDHLAIHTRPGAVADALTSMVAIVMG